jgi:hypothetical protein
VELLLTSSVPELELNYCVIYYDFFCEEVGSDGGFVLIRELLLDVPKG